MIVPSFGSRLVVLPFFIMKNDLFANRRFVDESNGAAMTSSYGGTTHAVHSVFERPTTGIGPFDVEEKKDVIVDDGGEVQRYPWPSTPTRPLPTAHYFYQPETPVYADLWEGLCPPLESTNRDDDRWRDFEGDVGGSWTPNEDPYGVAESIVRRCAPTSLVSEGTIEALATNLCESLRSYRDFCNVHILANRQHHDHQHPHNDDNHEHVLGHKHNNVRLKYRMMITRGGDGIKCPLFHYDHVPVRWIQTFVGPGVELVMDGVGVRWNAFYSFDRDDDEEDKLTIEERNTLRVDANVANVYCAPSGEAVLMIGNEFDGSIEGSTSQKQQHHQQPPAASSLSTSSRVRPVVHKSPKVPAGQVRVRFTQDIELCC